MDKATPVEMRKALQMVEALKMAGIRFVPIPKPTYRHRYICRECLDVEGYPGCIQEVVFSDDKPWPPTVCPHGMKHFGKQEASAWEILTIEEMQDDEK